MPIGYASAKPAFWYLRIKQLLTLMASVVFVVILDACETPRPEPEAKLQPRQIGSISTVENKDDCPDSHCISVEVQCEGVVEPASGRVVVSEPSGPKHGTIVIFSGGGGTSLWGTSEEDPSRYQEVITEWTEAGFRVVRVQWSKNWFDGTTPDEGFTALACRPATVTRWIADKIAEPLQPLCVGGGSGGSAQTSYLMTDYGFENRISLAVPWAGSWMDRIDMGCLDDDPRNASLHYADNARRAIDLSYGFGSVAWVRSGEPADVVPGPCSTRDPGFETSFLEASIAATGDYYYPQTLVWHILAGADEFGSLAHGLTYYEAMVRAGSPHVRLDVLPGAPHNLASEEAGLAKIRDVFLQECRFQ